MHQRTLTWKCYYSQFYRSWNWSSERVSELPWLTQLIKGQRWFWIRRCLMAKTMVLPLHHTASHSPLHKMAKWTMRIPWFTSHRHVGGHRGGFVLLHRVLLGITDWDWKTLKTKLMSSHFPPMSMPRPARGCAACLKPHPAYPAALNPAAWASQFHQQLQLWL